MLKSVIPDSSELVFMSDINRILISAIANVFTQAHHGHCLWHLTENVKGHACSVNKNIAGHRFMELGRYYTEADFNSAYDSFKISYPSAYKYVEEHTEKDKWARFFFPRDGYNMDTSNGVESMKNVFKEATRWALIPMLDCIIGKISDWFNQHRKDAVAGSIDSKLVPLVENYLHELWPVAQKLPVRELDSYEFEYEITNTEGKLFLASLVVLARCGIMKSFLVCTDWLLTYISLQTLAGTFISMSCAQNTTGRNCGQWHIPGHFMLCPTGLLGMYWITSRR